MALRGPLGYGTGHLMREDAMPCSRQARAMGGVGAAFGVFASMPFCFMQHGPRTTTVRVARWAMLGSLIVGSVGAGYTLLWEPCCEPQNVAAFDFPDKKR